MFDERGQNRENYGVVLREMVQLNGAKWNYNFNSNHDRKNELYSSYTGG